MIRLIFACICICTCLLSVQALVAQQPNYDKTKYNGFDRIKCNNDFATTPPQMPDAPACVNNDSYRAMSPDSWDGAVTSLPNKSNDWQPPTTPIAKSAPAANKSGPFQSASFAKDNAGSALPDSPSIPDSILTKGNNDFAPPQDSVLETQRSIIQVPATNVPPPPGVSNDHPDATWGSEPEELESAIAFEPKSAYRTDSPVIRNWGSPDNGEKFDFEEKKKEYPPMKEILATGRYFGSTTLQLLRPSFQSNSAISQSISGISSPFDFDYDAGPQIQIGFESKYGPGVEFNYWQYDQNSDTASFTSDGLENGTTSVWMLGQNRFSRLSTANNGDTLDAVHSFDMQTFSFDFFKELKFPISRLNAKFGYQYASISQNVDAFVADSGGAVTGVLRSNSDMRAWGPQVMFQYFRPVGHTKLELMTQFGGSALFGHRDQFVQNTSNGDRSSFTSRESITVFDFMSGVQYRKTLGENRCVFGRLGYGFQNWLGGGTGIQPEDDFGLRGWSFSFGFNR